MDTSFIFKLMSGNHAVDGNILLLLVVVLVSAFYLQHYFSKIGSEVDLYSKYNKNVNRRYEVQKIFFRKLCEFDVSAILVLIMMVLWSPTALVVILKMGIK